MTANYRIANDVFTMKGSDKLGLPVGNPDVASQEKGAILYNGQTGNVYVSDGITFREITGTGSSTRTAGELNLYIDGTGGNDSNNGLTSGTPVLTWTRLVIVAQSYNYDTIIVNLVDGQTESTFYESDPTPINGVLYKWDLTGIDCGKIIIRGGSSVSETKTPNSLSSYSSYITGGGNIDWATVLLTTSTVTGDIICQDINNKYYATDIDLNIPTQIHIISDSIPAGDVILSNAANLSNIDPTQSITVISNVCVQFELCKINIAKFKNFSGPDLIINGCSLSGNDTIESSSKITVTGSYIDLTSNNLINANRSFFNCYIKVLNVHNSTLECNTCKIDVNDLYSSKLSISNCMMFASVASVTLGFRYSSELYTISGDNDIVGGCRVIDFAKINITLNNIWEVPPTKDFFISYGGEFANYGTIIDNAGGEGLIALYNGHFINNGTIDLDIADHTLQVLLIDHGGTFTGSLVRFVAPDMTCPLVIVGNNSILNGGQDGISTRSTADGIVVRSGSTVISQTGPGMPNYGPGNDLKRGTSASGAWVYDTVFTTVATDEMTRVLRFEFIG